MDQSFGETSSEIAERAVATLVLKVQDGDTAHVHARAGRSGRATATDDEPGERREEQQAAGHGDRPAPLGAHR